MKKDFEFWLYLSKEGKPLKQPVNFKYKAKSKFLAYVDLSFDKKAKQYLIPPYNLF